ncbi:endo-1,4-beta-xylanase [Halosimplex litoreum]|uniref:Endo-1,4-beta-xylanase n=1 Tax=Halosimplex litoreum TaxID=1198301 RepID=A0A7T3FY65_9EURY|nr:endo-1,4-beta-xylanase [Halosimplex litoreum]QPV62806.1 endo-1,4-beta-xylanase [Halosimplex litoreum]
MVDDHVRGSESGENPALGRRSLLGALAAAGLAGCPSGGANPTTEAPDGGGGAGGAPATPSGTPATVPSGWPETRDPYYGALASTLGGEMGLPGGEFVYANDEAGASAAFGVGVEAAEATEIEVGDAQPFDSAVRVEVAEETENVWDVTMMGTATDTAVESGDVLLGVVYLRGPESSESESTVQFVAKDEDNLGTNMVRSTPEVQPPAGWTRYYVPIQFDYDAEAGTWRTELFLGYGPQTVDIGGIALVDFGADVAVEDLPSGPADEVRDGGTDGGTADGDWEAAADERIAEHRTSDLTVEVVDADGAAITDAEVEAAMQAHEFGFGTAVSADFLTEESEDADTYREHVSDLFDLAVLGNHHKWRFWEENRALSDAATDWLESEGLDIRGHVCLWSDVSAWSVPPDVVRAMGVQWEENGVTDPDLDPEYVRERTLEHVPAIIDYYGDRITEWEVANEIVHKPGLIQAANGVAATDDATLDDVDLVESPILAEWYAAARDAAPEGMPLGVNDYNTLSGPYESTRDDYERQIEFLADAEAGLDFAGLQCHFNRESSLSPAAVKAGLDRYAETGVRLRITEFDMADENWDEADKAVFFRQFLKIAFSHPAVDDFLVWGIYSPNHWRDDAPFFADGWEEKPALEEYRSLVFDEWWTEASGRTDDEGTFSTTGFQGAYEVTATIDGTEVTETVTLSDGGATVELAPRE